MLPHKIVELLQVQIKQRSDYAFDNANLAAAKVFWLLPI